MEQLAKLISAISSLAWPAIFLVVIFTFSESIKKLIDSARGRKFTIKVAGNELTMEEASAQTRVMLIDMQTKIAELEKNLVKKPEHSEKSLMPSSPSKSQPLSPTPSMLGSAGRAIAADASESKKMDDSIAVVAKKELRTRRILWVDNNPKNNSFLIASLEERGDKIDIALTTQEGIEKFKTFNYDIVISDMTRSTDEKAGIMLSKQIKTLKPNTPVYIFCSYWTAKYMRDEALREGVDEITSSATSLMGFIS
jgi:CheY-like chemotaxis protein